MGFLQDAIAIFKKRDVTFIDSYKESEEVYTFRFEKDKDVTWKAGQHGLFTITHKKIKNGIRPITLASAPAENVIQLTLRISNDPSDFKKAMLELKQGMKIRMSGPVGSFYLKDDSPSVLIAGGIGITPFRSMLKQLEAEGNGVGKEIHLLYMDGKNSFVYKDELDEILNNTSIDVTYLDARDDLQKEINKLSSLHGNNGKYYIAGPKSMVESISAHLQSNAISKKSIQKDVFIGY
ncbi:FAD-dependent oxidoreductase [Sporosarcina sp. ACRSL]|uniref:FAD-dependent oxidoreductase n=1 Tax=Sporosarcina sp. ACRSL TaxID=2918215 RepID=UPI001EF51C9E|nr:FAD-dependent oxidoreductase [Sporosarcina sp. ACRSL]MCG7343555.1 FAD-dependent oxidoreductase [Sporosarcina sp. ACRSL]